MLNMKKVNAGNRRRNCKQKVDVNCVAVTQQEADVGAAYHTIGAY